MRLTSRSRILEFSGRSLVMAALNATPDSSVGSSRSMDPGSLAEKAVSAVHDGAGIIDIGGESTGPESENVSMEEELRRVIPAVKAVRSALPDVWISVDTSKAGVAKASLASGADMINDVTAGRGDPAMLPFIAESGCPYILMYAKDPSPRTTKADTHYDDVVAAIRAFLLACKAACEEAGISQIIVDPGLGHFVSSIPSYSFEILRRLREFSDMGPVLVSPSRKSFLAGPEKLPSADRLPGTAAASAIAVMNGASYIRTHDVLEVRRACEIAEKILSTKH